MGVMTVQLLAVRNTVEWAMGLDLTWNSLHTEAVVALGRKKKKAADYGLVPSGSEVNTE